MILLPHLAHVGYRRLQCLRDLCGAGGLPAKERKVFVGVATMMATTTVVYGAQEVCEFAAHIEVEPARQMQYSNNIFSWLPRREKVVSR